MPDPLGHNRTVPEYMDKTVVGWRETVDLPDWGVKGMIAKVDTGARTSAIHVENVEHVGEDRVSFEVVTSRKPNAERIRVVAPVKRLTSVRSSIGKAQERIVVETTMILGHHERLVELSLVSRKKMLCRMLLGRRALEGDFVVDVSLKHTKRRKR
ncbi:MAG TPA: RimK/LysX family protein [Fimbriimonadaceae bacterium]|nr:RimK/LysX family protein [Fimbriimonadaceae bacterium]